ncbi:MAG: hypothetical protein HGA47_10120, partial [Zoogloea sp.]|nr:hypothetical protein [Zoogloea sp.]
MTTRIYTLELSGLDSSGSPAVFRAADDIFVTGAADTPAHTHYLRRLSQPGNFAAELFSGSALSGNSRTGGGEIVLANADGRLDMLLDWAVDGRALVVRRGQPGQIYPAGWQVVLRGTAAGLSVRGDDLVIRLRDRAAELETTMARPIYAGSNVLPDGVEGVETDLKGKTKPRLYGVVRNISPVPVNTARLIYQVSDRAATVTAAYDSGVALTRGADYADLAGMMATTPAAGEYRALPALGLLRLGV